MTERPHEELISAYLDGELSPEERAEVEQLLANNAEARQLLEEFRALGGGLRSLPQRTLPRDFSDRVLLQAEREVLIGNPPKAQFERAPDEPRDPFTVVLHAPRRLQAWRWAIMAVAVSLAIWVFGQEDLRRGPNVAVQVDRPPPRERGEVMRALPEAAIEPAAEPDALRAAPEAAEGIVHEDRAPQPRGNRAILEESVSTDAQRGKAAGRELQRSRRLPRQNAAARLRAGSPPVPAPPQPRSELVAGAQADAADSPSASSAPAADPAAAPSESTAAPLPESIRGRNAADRLSAAAEPVGRAGEQGAERRPDEPRPTEAQDTHRQPEAPEPELLALDVVVPADDKDDDAASALSQVLLKNGIVMADQATEQNMHDATQDGVATEPGSTPPEFDVAPVVEPVNEAEKVSRPEIAALARNQPGSAHITFVVPETNVASGAYGSAPAAAAEPIALYYVEATESQLEQTIADLQAMPGQFHHVQVLAPADTGDQESRYYFRLSEEPSDYASEDLNQQRIAPRDSAPAAAAAPISPDSKAAQGGIQAEPAGEQPRVERQQAPRDNRRTVGPADRLDYYDRTVRSRVLSTGTPAASQSRAIRLRAELGNQSLVVGDANQGQVRLSLPADAVKSLGLSRGQRGVVVQRFKQQQAAGRAGEPSGGRGGAAPLADPPAHLYGIQPEAGSNWVRALLLLRSNETAAAPESRPAPPSGESVPPAPGASGDAGDR